jgi:hypothetical protein
MADDDKPRDGWSKVEILLAAVAGILLPIVVAGVGGTYTYMQDKHNGEELAQQKVREQVLSRAQTATTLLEHLASDSARERLLAVKVAEHLAKDKMLPDELVPALIEIARADDSSAVSGAAAEAVASTTTVTQLTTEGTVREAASTASATLKKLPARVYIHIRTEDQRSAARGFSNALEEVGLSVPGIERRDQGPRTTELRYFQGSDPADIELIMKTLSGASLPVKSVDLSKRFTDAKIRPRHYELWIAPAR